MITELNISQSNQVGSSNLIAIHNPVAFIIDAYYSGAAPTKLYCDIQDEESNVLATYSCIPYRDLTDTLRQFVFQAQTAVKALMDDFDDFYQLVYTLEYVEGLTRKLVLKFYDPANVTIAISTTCVFTRAAMQFGENVNLSSQFNNDSDVYYGLGSSFAYVYFYNSNNLDEVSATVI